MKLRSALPALLALAAAAPVAVVRADYALDGSCIPDPALPCTDLFSSLPDTGTDPVVVPCGSCVKFDLSGDVAIAGGLDVRGRLVFDPDGSYANVTAPFVFVEGKLDIVMDEEVRPENRRVTFTLSGTSDVTLTHHGGGDPIDAGKKAFVVAGGQVEIDAFPSGNSGSCPTWTRLHSFASGGAAALTEEQRTVQVLPPGGCDASVFDHSFAASDNSWTQGEGDSAGSSCELDGADGAMIVSDRVRDFQGPAIDLTQERGCLVADVDYLFTAEVAVKREGMDGQPTTCKAGNGGCLQLENWVMHQDDGEAELVPHQGKQVKATAGNYNEYVHFTVTLRFAEADLAGVYNALVLTGPDSGDDISMRNAKLVLPDASSYDGPTCDQLVRGGDAEGNGLHPHPVYAGDAYSRALVLEEEGVDGGNRYYSHVQRQNKWDSLVWGINGHCMTKNQVYAVSANVRIRSPDPVTYHFELRKCHNEACASSSNGDYTDFTIAEFDAQGESDGWVAVGREVTLPAAIEGGVKYFLRYQLGTVAGDNYEKWTVDVDDVSLEFSQGVIRDIVVPDDVTGCWGPGSEVLITSHTLSWDEHQVAVIDGVNLEADGTSTITLVDSIVPPTTMASELPDMAVEVALLSRNVVIRGDDDDTTDDDHGAYFSVYLTPNIDQTVEGIEFLRVGQRGIEDRFGVHVKRSGSLPGTSVSKNSFVSSSQRCVVLQDVHDVKVEGNVAYDTRGHCFMTMDGSEKENRFLYNLGAMTSVSDVQLSGSYSWEEHDEPATFYMRGVGNYYEGNVAAGSQVYGYWFHPKDKVKDETNTLENSRKQIARSFEDNVAHSNSNDAFRFQDYNRDDKTQHSYLRNIKAYRNKDSGVYGYYSYNFGILGGFFADNEKGIELYRSVGITPLVDVTIHGETSLQRDLVAKQGADSISCSESAGIRMGTYKRYTGYNLTSEWINVHFADFDEWDCGSQPVFPIYFTNDREEERFNWETSMTNVTADDSRGLRLDSCAAADKDIDDVLMWDLNSAFNPDPTSTFSGVSVLVSDTDFMKAFAGGPCTDYTGCISYCEDTCLRTVTFYTEDFGTENFTLHVSEVGGSGRSIDVPSNYFNKYSNNPNTLADYNKLRMFSCSLPAGQFVAEFRDGNGVTAWPTFAEEKWNPAPPCEGHANPGDITLTIPNATEEECFNLVRNGDMSETLPGLYKRYGSTIVGVEGEGIGGSMGLVHKGRSKKDYGIGQYVDTRCVRDNFFKQYEFRALLKLKDDSNVDVDCDPNNPDDNYGCPEVTMRLKYYKDNTKKDGFSSTWPYPKGRVVMPFIPGGWHLLQGVFTWDENKGLPIEDKSSIFWFLDNYHKDKNLYLGDVSITRLDDTCDGNLVWNGDFKTGTTEYWDKSSTDHSLMMVEGIDGGDDLAVKAYNRAGGRSRSPKALAKIGCLEPDKFYIFRAKYRIEKSNGDLFACNPESTVYEERCPEARLRSYRRTESPSTTYGTTDGNRNLANPVAPTDATGWNSIAGFYKATAHDSVAEEVQVYFHYLDEQYNLIVDNVTFTKYDGGCGNLVLNPSFEGGDAEFWRSTDRDKGFLDVYSPGAGGTGYAVHVHSRTEKKVGVRTNLDFNCIKEGNIFEVHAKFRLINSTGHGVTCDVNSRSDTSSSAVNCPPVYIDANRCEGSDTKATLWNELLDVTWDPDNFNSFYAQFGVDANVASCKDVFLFVAYVHSDWDLLVDDVSVSTVTQAPTPSPTFKPTPAPVTSQPTEDGTRAPTVDPTSAPTLVADDCPPVGENKTLNSNSVSLTIVGEDALCTLTKVTTDAVTGNVAGIVPLARSYDGQEWNTAAGEVASTLLAGQTWKCYTSACEIDLPVLGSSNEKYVLTSYSHSLPIRDEVARFLETTTFGVTLDDLDQWDYSLAMNVSMAAWVKEQMDSTEKPISSHRQFWRQRANARWTFPQHVGQSNHPCAANSRWRKATFTEKDQWRNRHYHFLGVRSETSNGETKFILSVDGQDRTTVSDFRFSDPLLANYTFNESFPYRICESDNEYVGGRFRIRDDEGTGDCEEIVGGNPAVDFTSFEDYTCTSARCGTFTLPDIGFSADELRQIDSTKFSGNNDGEYIIVNGLDESLCSGIGAIYDSDPPVLGKLPDGTWLMFDPRIELKENTPSNPLLDGGGLTESKTEGDILCSNAPRTFLNFDDCKLSNEGSACGDIATPVTEIPLDDENIRKIHELTGRYVYGILGLVVKQTNTNVPYEVSHPCIPGSRSRWLKSSNAACVSPTALQSTTNETLTQQILDWGEEQDNPVIRDIFFPNSDSEITCDPLDVDVEIEIQVGDDCWTHVHPDYLSVYDMTYWTYDNTHPGNAYAAMMGHYNPIKKWMDLQNSSTLTFPSTFPEHNHSTHRRMEMGMDNMTMMNGNHSFDHPMGRWETHNVKFSYVGRMYDIIRFRDLPNQLRLDEVAVYYNATGDVAGSGILVCGSPGEVDNDPELGSNGFDLTADDDSDTSSSDFYKRQKGVTWTMSVLTAEDQLRQRVAWALSQLLVVVPSAVVSGSRDTEIHLNYYDIFVRHAFGNYRDILKEISYSPMMAENLSYLQSKSHAYMRESASQLTFADENFAREIMQLFTIGMVQLYNDGTPKLDDNGKTIQTYTNEHIMNFARVWTGFDYQLKRGNFETVERSRNRLDPMKIVASWRDRFPKMDLSGGYIGDQYPLCVDLPRDMFLRKGAKYRLLGSSSLPELMDADPAYLTDPTIRKFVLDDNSMLKALLCGGDCSSPSQNEVTLNATLTCSGDECDVDTVRVVQVAAGIEMYFEYVRPPCVELAFYSGAKMLSKKKKSDPETMCGNPLLPVALEACCTNPFAFFPVAEMNNLYDGERVTFATADSRCDTSLCDFDKINVTKEDYHKTGYHWTTDPCNIDIKVDSEGNIALVYQMDAYTSKVMHIDDGTLNYFPAKWDALSYPSKMNNCGGGVCTSLSEGGCRCETSVHESVVFDNFVPSSPEEILSLLNIGHLDPSVFDDVNYNVQQEDGFKIHKKDGNIDENTVFEVSDSTGRTHFLKNVRSTVNIPGGFSFRNMPHFMSLIPDLTDVRDAQYETEAALDHYFYQENTAPFLAIRFIQRFGISNPTPHFVDAVATAFRLGMFESGGEVFGTGNYGDLAATVAAVVLHEEARTVVLDADPAHGSLREPLLKVIATMRSLDFTTVSDITLIEFLSVGMENTIGQMAYEFPTVFSFFLPEFIPSGVLTEASLVSPEAMLMDMPKIIATLNGFFGLIKNGLEKDDNGFGKNGSPSGSLTYNASGKNVTTIVNELATLLTAGRLSAENRQIVAEAYNDAVAVEGEAGGLEMAQQLIATSAEFHSTNTVKKTGTERVPAGSVGGQSTSSYKAVVFLMFAGGCDSYNMLIPHTCSVVGNETDLNTQYVDIRESVALVRESLLPINATNQDCEVFGLHPNLPILQQLYNDNDALFVANAGVLEKPVDKDNYREETVTQLFAHNTMQLAGKRVDPFEVYPGSGILGRMTDVLHRNNVRTNAISIDNPSIAVVGQPGVSPSPNIVSRKGIQEFNENPTTNKTHMLEAIHEINSATADDSGFMGETWSSLLFQSLASNEQLKASLESALPNVTFPEGNTLGEQFEMTTRLMQTADARGVDRDVFFLQMGGYDHHSSVEANLASKFASVDAAVGALVNELKIQGLWDDVVLVQVSDFARTLSPNSGDGTDHAWGGNYFLLGGDLNGGHILGKYPSEITDGAPLNVGRGRIIPTTSWEHIWNGVAEWMGVGNADLDEVCPNRGNFAEADLFTSADLFDSAASGARGRERKMYLRK